MHGMSVRIRADHTKQLKRLRDKRYRNKKRKFINLFFIKKLESIMRWSVPICGDGEKLIRYWVSFDGLKTDWKIEKWTNTDKPYVLAVVCTGQRYGTFNHLSNAKMAAFLLDHG
jgi:hypothetical protein